MHIFTMIEVDMKSHLMPIRISKKRKCEDKEEDYLYSTVENSHFLDQTERKHSVSQLMLLLFFFSIDCCCFRLVRKIKTKTKKMRKHLTFNFQPVAFITEVLAFLFSSSKYSFLYSYHDISLFFFLLISMSVCQICGGSNLIF